MTFFPKQPPYVSGVSKMAASRSWPLFSRRIALRREIIWTSLRISVSFRMGVCKALHCGPALIPLTDTESWRMLPRISSGGSRTAFIFHILATTLNFNPTALLFCQNHSVFFGFSPKKSVHTAASSFVLRHAAPLLTHKLFLQSEFKGSDQRSCAILEKGQFF